MDLPRLVLIGCLSCCQMIICNQVQAASLSDVGTVCAVENGTAVFPWSLTLGPGEMLNRINWEQSAPTFVDLLEVDGSGTPTSGGGRASTNGSAFLILTNVTASDVGTYRCTVRITGTPGQQDQAELELKKLPDLEYNITVTQDTSTSVTVGWSEVPVNRTCDEVLTYYIEYKLESSGSWVLAGSVRGSEDGNTTLTFTVTGLNTTGSYKFGVTAENSLGNSSRVESSPVFFTGELPDGVTISQSVTLTCSSTGGRPPPTYTWKKDGTTIHTATSNILVINPFQVKDEGEYTCIATNVGGQSEGSLKLKKLDVRVIIGSTLGAIGGLAIIVAAVVYAVRKRKNKG